MYISYKLDATIIQIGTSQHMPLPPTAPSWLKDNTSMLVDLEIWHTHQREILTTRVHQSCTQLIEKYWQLEFIKSAHNLEILRISVTMDGKARIRLTQQKRKPATLIVANLVSINMEPNILSNLYLASLAQKMSVVRFYPSKSMPHPCRSDTIWVWVWDPHWIWSTYLGCFSYIYDQVV